MVAALDGDVGVHRNGLPRLVDPPVAHKHIPRQHQSLRPRAAVSEAKLDKTLVDTGFEHKRSLDEPRVARYLTCMADLDPPQSKFAAYRARKKAAGLREVRMWVPDVNAPGFREEAARQAALLDHTEEEREISAFMESAAAEAWRDWK